RVSMLPLNRNHFFGFDRHHHTPSRNQEALPAESYLGQVIAHPASELAGRDLLVLGPRKAELAVFARASFPGEPCHGLPSPLNHEGLASPVDLPHIIAERPVQLARCYN